MTETPDGLMIESIECGDNIAFILNDADDFSQNDFRYLENYEEGCFLKCCKTSYNGKTELIYLTENSVSLSTLSRDIQPENIIFIFQQLVDAIDKTEETGCLSCEKLLISPDAVYICPEDMRIKLVYLPLTKGCCSGFPQLCHVLRQMIHTLILNNEEISDELFDFDSALINENIDISSVLKHFSKELDEDTYEMVPEAEKTLIMTAINAPEPLVITMNKDRFIVGRSANVADGAVAFNRFIGKKHCMLLKENDSFSIVDMESTNKTYVNGKVLKPNIPTQIRHGDIVRLANTDFEISIT